LGSKPSEPIGDLKGNTLRIYIYLLKKGSAGVREIQRALNLGSPALAQYHLEKLVHLGLAQPQSGVYHLVKEVKVDVLREFIKLGSYLLPRFLVYAVMFTVLLAYFLLQLSDLNFYSFWALIFATLSVCILWYETVAAWRRMP